MTGGKSRERKNAWGQERRSGKWNDEIRGREMEKTNDDDEIHDLSWVIFRQHVKSTGHRITAESSLETGLLEQFRFYFEKCRKSCLRL